METRTSQLLGRLSESATIAMSRKARELKAAGRDIISLSLGEPDFDTPEPMKAAGIQAIEDNFTHYPPVPGYPEVRQAICDKLKRDNGLDYTTDQIVISTGAKHSLMNVVLSLVDAGDEVILPAPLGELRRHDQPRRWQGGHGGDRHRTGFQDDRGPTPRCPDGPHAHRDGQFAQQPIGQRLHRGGNGRSPPS